MFCLDVFAYPCFADEWCTTLVTSRIVLYYKRGSQRVSESPLKAYKRKHLTGLATRQRNVVLFRTPDGRHAILSSLGVPVTSAQYNTAGRSNGKMGQLRQMGQKDFPHIPKVPAYSTPPIRLRGGSAYLVKHTAHFNVTFLLLRS
jgi:hypothetical protein